VNYNKASYVFLGTDNKRKAFILVETFISCSLGIDYFIRFVSSPAWGYFFTSKYSILDIACFTGVTYFSFALLDLDPQRLQLSYYNMFLLSGAVRFTRVRRSFMSLDHSHVVITRSGKSKHVYTLGPFSLRPITARITLLCVRVTLYILAMTSLIMVCICMTQQYCSMYNYGEGFYELEWITGRLTFFVLIPHSRAYLSFPSLSLSFHCPFHSIIIPLNCVHGCRLLSIHVYPSYLRHCATRRCNNFIW
jgi:hypothetical protein